MLSDPLTRVLTSPRSRLDALPNPRQLGAVPTAVGHLAVHRIEVIMNIVVVRGTLSSPPVERELPSGDRLVTYEVTVRAEGAPTESVPVVWFEAPAQAAALAQGAEVLVVGRVRRRYFRAGGGTGSRTEVVADVVLAAGQRVRRARAVEQVRTALALLAV